MVNRVGDFGFALGIFALFYLPLMTCMFYTSSAYYFCWGEVKAKRELMGKIWEKMVSGSIMALFSMMLS